MRMRRWGRSVLAQSLVPWAAMLSLRPSRLLSCGVVCVWRSTAHIGTCQFHDTMHMDHEQRTEDRDRCSSRDPTESSGV
jgi:hypothetical protein